MMVFSGVKEAQLRMVDRLRI